MKHRHINIFVPLFFIITLGVIVYFLFNQQSFSVRNAQIRQTKVITPQTNSYISDSTPDSVAERMAYEDLNLSKIALASDEQIVSIITQNMDADPQDEQIIAYRKNTDLNGPIMVAYIDFDEATGLYNKAWEQPTLATKARTVRLLLKDLIGDRSNCIILEGLNDSGEQTLTAFLIPTSGYDIKKIAEMKVDGTIVITETDRSQAYAMGISSGAAFTISTFGRDLESTNLLDQIEIKYAYNKDSGVYERIGTARIPGNQIEQRQIRELLDGTAGKFEQFLNGLWYYTGSGQDVKQYIYFDVAKREIIFYEDKTQEVYRWQNSSSTRYGIYISSQNLSVTTLRRLIDISLETKDSIVIRIFEDVQLKIGITGHWDGVYQKVAKTLNSSPAAAETRTIDAWVNARYDGASDSIVFDTNGNFEKTSQGKTVTGNYSFYLQNGIEILELRYASSTMSVNREVYKVERRELNKGPVRQKIMELTKVRLGINGIENVNEGTMQYVLVK
ncbi:pallilysin-related adhesin [Gracilinema caldarium]|uniref:pallilysin-related adhesin n=1 Tax=Gracilinema caldarium TaxID=215591 RepID=UPI0026F143E6|nr:pallilysin-related adhesin [Gracilinema caldarium]